VEAREEAEMLRLQLDGAKEERAGALHAAAAAQARPQWEFLFCLRDPASGRQARAWIINIFISSAGYLSTVPRARKEPGLWCQHVAACVMLPSARR